MHTTPLAVGAFLWTLPKGNQYPSAPLLHTQCVGEHMQHVCFSAVLRPGQGRRQRHFFPSCLFPSLGRARLQPSDYVLRGSGTSESTPPSTPIERHLPENATQAGSPRLSLSRSCTCFVRAPGLRKESMVSMRDRYTVLDRRHSAAIGSDETTISASVGLGPYVRISDLEQATNSVWT